MSTPSVAKRSTIRKYLAAHLKTFLGSAVKEVYDYQIATFGKQTPVVCVVSGPSDRTQLIQTSMRFDIHIFTRYQDSQAVPAYTEEQSEDKQDDLEAEVSNFIMLYGDNSDGDKSISADPIPWLALTLEGPTDLSVSLDEGIDYRHEVVPVICVAGNIS